ncbi:MAG: hypothetical protein H6740_15130 [Alphaproteobacteria bacterium]|nr:hypothetical protein [Alphaproteobacteria bacterium]
MRPALLLGGLGGLVLLALAASAGGEPAPTPGRRLEPVPPSDMLQGAVPLDGMPDVWLKPGVVFNGQLLTFLALLRLRVPRRIPLVVTSGVRTAEAQAHALQRKRQLGDDLNLLYQRGYGPQIVAQLLAVPNEVPAMAAVLQRWMDQGVYMSRHMRGDALDLRNRSLSAADQALIVQAVQSMGARALIEKTPSHIHLEGVADALRQPGVLS